MAKESEKRKQHEQEKSRKTGLAIASRGRVFEGVVVKAFPTRVAIEFERTVYIQKYERFLKKKTRLHARIPQGLEVNKGDYVKIRECRPLSKIIHFIVISVVKKVQEESA